MSVEVFVLKNIVLLLLTFRHNNFNRNFMIIIKKNKISKEAITPQNIDLNTITVSGFYRIQDGITNVPEGSLSYYNQLIVSKGQDTIVQMLFPYSTSEYFFIRTGKYIGQGNKEQWNKWAKYSGVINN